MKLSNFYPALLSLFALTLVSCELTDYSQEPGTYADSASFVTVHQTNNIDPSVSDFVYYFEMDNGTFLYLADKDENYDEYTFKDQKRVVLYYAVIEDYSSTEDAQRDGAAYGCDYGLRLFGVDEVFTAESAVVTTKEESKAIEDDRLEYIYNSISYSDGYINMIAGTDYNYSTDIQFYVVENLYEEAGETDNFYINLELRYDDGVDDDDDVVGSTVDNYVSINMEDYIDRIISEDKAGIILRANTTASGGDVYIKVEVDPNATNTMATATDIY